MATLNLNDETAQEAINSGKPVVIDFWAEWCHPCRAMAPVVDEIAEEYKDKVLFGKYDIEDDDCVNIPVEYGIRSIPTLLFFKDGKLVTRNTGSTSKEKITSIIDGLL